VQSYISMFDRFCPHKEGDNVRLSKDYPVEKNSGWWCSRHLMKKGTKATIVERGYSDGKFTFGIQFKDGNTWIDPDSDEIRLSNREGGIFTFREEDLISGWRGKSNAT